MEGMTLAEAAEAMGGELVGDGSDVFPTGGCIDTRVLNLGELFFAFSGERVDGHRFVNQALEKGASAAVVNRAWYAEQGAVDGPLVVVQAVDLAMGKLGRAYRDRFQIPVVGITGSTGKTTTKEMTATVLRTRYRVLATEGNLNTRLGVPLTLFRLSSEDDVAVIEMGISEHGDLRYLCEIADPTIGVITNVGPTHLEFLGSVEGVAKAKGEILDYLDESSLTILNLDDLLLSKERAKIKGRLLGFGIEEICQLRGEGLNLDQDCFGHFSLQGHLFHLSIPGRHNVYNALAATAVGVGLGVLIEDAARVLAQFWPPKLRSQILEQNGVRLLNDAYNANPASMHAALSVLAEMQVAGDGRRIAVLGDMLELGTHTQDAHQELGLYAGSRVDLLFTLGNHACQVVKAAVEGGLSKQHVRAFDDPDALIEAIRETLHRDDLMLIKGSRGLAMEEVAQALGFQV